jgi:hypothetical protein
LLAVFVARNIDEITTNSDIHSINTWHKSNLYPPLLRLTKYQKGVYYTGIKIYNCLPLKIKELSGNINHFKKVSQQIPFTRLLLYYGRIPWLDFHKWFIHFVFKIDDMVFIRMLP